jgi:hypothetical protein
LNIERVFTVLQNIALCEVSAFKRSYVFLTIRRVAHTFAHFAQAGIPNRSPHHI